MDGWMKTERERWGSLGNPSVYRWAGGGVGEGTTGEEEKAEERKLGEDWEAVSHKNAPSYDLRHDIIQDEPLNVSV